MSGSDLHPTETSRLQWLKHAITMVRTSSVTIAIFDIRALATGGNLAAEGEVILVAVSRTTLVDMSIVSRNYLYLFILQSSLSLQNSFSELRCIVCYGQWLSFSCSGMCGAVQERDQNKLVAGAKFEIYRAA